MRCSNAWIMIAYTKPNFCEQAGRVQCPSGKDVHIDGELAMGAKRQISGTSNARGRRVLSKFG
jgi:hypothetical protein